MEIKALSMADQLRTIRPVENIIPKGIGETPKSGEHSGKGVSFAEFLSQQFNEANRLGLEADKAITRSAMGEEANPHDTVIAVQKADIALTLLMSVKERIERAYQEIIRTPI